MSRLAVLRRHWKHRQVGNTTFMLYGLSYDRPAIILFTTLSSARHAMDEVVRAHPGVRVNWASMTIGEVRFATIALLRLDGVHMPQGIPVMVDHHALDSLIVEYSHKLIGNGHE